MPYYLLPDDPTSSAFERLAIECVDEALEAIRGDDRKAGVHEARKACKRLRALLRLFRSGLGDGYKGDRYKKADRQVRDAARTMSAIRDQDVLPQTLTKLSEAVNGTVAFSAIESIQTTLREHSGIQGDPEDIVRRATEELQALRDEAVGWHVRHARRAAADGVRKTYKQGRKDRQNCSVDGPAEPWHAWRKHVKYHGYHAKLLSQLHPAGEAYAAPWDQLGKLLGDEHDLSVLEERLTETTLSQSPESPLVLEAARSRRAALREEIAKQAAALYRLKPRTVAAIVLDLLPE